MDAAPLVSVVVPVHQGARFLAETLASIQAQTERRWECVVVDDGSTDDTAQIARSIAAQDPRFRVLSTANRGASAARNHGFRETSPNTRYVSFMDGDDVWLPQALAALLSAAEARPDVIGSHGLAEFIQADGSPLLPGVYAETGRRRLGRAGRRLEVYSLDRPTDFDVLINGNVLFPPGLVLARREAYLAVGPFDETLSGAEDWDVLIRLSRRGPLALVDEVLLHYRRHDANLGAAATVAEQAWRVRCLGFYAPENSSAQKASARLGWRAYQLHLARDHGRTALTGLKAGRARRVGRAVLGIAVCGIRYVRGRPLPRVERPPLTW